MARGIIITFFVLCSVVSGAQNIGNDLEEPSRLHKQYRFEEAISQLEGIKNKSQDSVLLSKVDSLLLLCRNGKAMLDFGDKPVVVASMQTTKESMLLYIPSLENRTWVRTPSDLSNVDISTMYDYVFFPENASSLFYSSVGEDGKRDLFVMQRISDGTWSSPKRLHDNICSPGNEVFPMLSKDGRRLYFASDGISGYGGFDVYFSEWNDDLQDWGVPQNVGFPYNSPENDYVFLDGYDGVFSYLISDRGSRGREVSLYALMYNSTPVKYEIGEQEAAEIARLRVYSVEKKEPAEVKDVKIPEEYRGYYEIKKLIDELKQEISGLQAENDKSRELYRTLGEEDRNFIRKQIVENESTIGLLRKSMNAYAVELHKCEMELMSKGLEIPEEELTVKKPEMAEISLPEPPEFIRKSAGTMPEMEIKPAEPEVDLELKVLDEAVVLDEKYLPEMGLYYQVQLFTVAGKVRTSQLKGLSPVFAERTKTGKYIYRAGLFYTYKSAVEGMNKVKRAGIKSVFLSAVMDGKSISVKQARNMELSGEAKSYQIAMSAFSEGIPGEVVQLLRNACDKDLAKVVEAGKVIYIIGPFSNRADVDRIVSELESIQVKGIEIREI